MNAICAKNAELALVITAEVDQAAATLAGACQRHLVDRSDALPVFILEQYNRLARHRRGQAKIRKLNYVARNRLLRRKGGLGLWIHFTIEAEAMYPLK
jgi:hypothetical protein